MFFEIAMRRQVVLVLHELGNQLHTQWVVFRRLLLDLDVLRCYKDHGYYVAITIIENRIKVSSALEVDIWSTGSISSVLFTCQW
ncbi:unnamed protein product [Sphagnum balticum]